MKRIIIILILFGLNFQGYSQSLNDYLELAAQNNPGLQSLYKNFEASMSKAAQTGALPDPNLSFGYFISPVETRVGPQRAKFSLTQMFPWFGSLKEQENVNTLLAEAKYQNFIDARNKLYFRVSEVYYQINEVYQLINIEEENISLLSSYRGIANSKFQNNSGSMVDALRVDIKFKESKANLQILFQKVESLKLVFNNILNRQVNDTIIIIENTGPSVVQKNDDTDSMFISHPLISEINTKIKAYESNEQVSIKQGLPKFGLGLDYVIVQKRNDVSIPDNGKDIIMPMFSLSVPIFRSKYNNQRKESQLMQESFQLQKEELINQLESTLEMKRFNISRQLQYILVYEEELNSYNQILNLLYSSYSNSGKDFEEVLRVQQEILNLNKKKISAIAEQQILAAEINYITAQKIL